MEKSTRWDSNKVRETFLEFFRSKQHVIVPSAPIVVKDDPTLMFTNAGMNQFKDIFLGNSPVASPRIADSQKCLRVSGKHNDLDEVGHDTYHHTMFEMLGNWSFGDYFKKEAIEWAWELLTGVYGMDKDRIYATIFEGSEEDGVERDAEAMELWKKFLPESQIILGNKADNFWEMGDTGPCGPCSEIHFDLRSDEERKKIDGRELVNHDHPHVIEIWNLVFMQFNRKANGSLEPLPAQHVDTGMGFERLCMILQGKQSNYDTDVFQPTIISLAELSGRRYGEHEAADIAMRVVADHLRTIAFSIADGQLPSNVKAGYVIRRILRRAVRYGYTYLGFTEPFMCKLIGGLADRMGGQFPELLAQRGLIESVMFEEESSFLRTLATGINLLESTIKRAKNSGVSIIEGKDAFTLYDTYGFPIDLTELIAREQGLTVDLKGFESELEAQKKRSRSDAAITAEDWIEVTAIGESVFVGYDAVECDVKIARYRKVEAKGKEFYQVVFDQTPFYGNSGGQVGDSGYLEGGSERFTIKDTHKENTLTVHIMDKMPNDTKGVFRAVVNLRKRNAIAANHTATHLMHEALRSVLGQHVEQKGSLVESKYLRFDFAHFQKVTDEQIAEVERIVNSKIRENLPIEEVRRCPIEDARGMGAMMLFGEKYGTHVRVVGFGSSTELCGGTHTTATGSIGLFKILSESAISAGVRRIEAVTGEEAEMYVVRLEETIKEIQKFVNNPSVLQAVRKMLEDNEELKRQMEEYRREKIEELIVFISNETEVAEDGVVWVTRRLDAPADIIKDVAFAFRQKISNLVMIIGSHSDEKTTLTVMLGDEVVARGVNASQVIGVAAKEINGGGGGQPFYAMAGGKNPEGIEKAIVVAVDLIKSKLK